jgi:outer membrane lipoprotein-sorting protein
MRSGTAAAAGLGLVLALTAGAPSPSEGAGPKSAVFSVMAVHTGNGEVRIGSRVWVTSTQARADVHHPLQGDLKFLVTNGSLYQLDPKSKKGVKSPLPAAMTKSADNFMTFIQKFTFDAGGVLKRSKKLRSEKIAGFNCDVLTSTESQGQASRTITVWLPQQMSPRFPLKAILSDKLNKPDANLEQDVTITLSDIKLNVPVPASVFSVPADYQIKTVSPPAAGRGK